MFAAAAAEAPLTNLVTMFGTVYWRGRLADSTLRRIASRRFAQEFWDSSSVYVRNSPIFHAGNVSTPLLLQHNESDTIVDFNQGTDFYNTLRGLGKPVVLVQYAGEGHNLTNAANQMDYAKRLSEFFSHFLQGGPTPDWWTSSTSREQARD